MLSVASGNSGAGEAIDKATCGICRRQVSRYTCPSCNVPYCSLACFRSDGHAQCSEAFYKHELELEIRTQPSASMEERKRMMDMLKKFEEEGRTEDVLKDEEEEEEEEEEDRDSLVERLGNSDLDSMSASDLWNALSPAERESFLSMIRDPGSTSALELLHNAGIDSNIILPWQEAPETLTGTDEVDARVTAFHSSIHDTE